MERLQGTPSWTEDEVPQDNFRQLRESDKHRLQFDTQLFATDKNKIISFANPHKEQKQAREDASPDFDTFRA
jgi:hypothetical protein